MRTYGSGKSVGKEESQQKADTTYINTCILTYDTELSIGSDCLVEPCWANLTLVFCIII